MGGGAAAVKTSGAVAQSSTASIKENVEQRRPRAASDTHKGSLSTVGKKLSGVFSSSVAAAAGGVSGVGGNTGRRPSILVSADEFAERENGQKK